MIDCCSTINLVQTQLTATKTIIIVLLAMIIYLTYLLAKKNSGNKA